MHRLPLGRLAARCAARRSANYARPGVTSLERSILLLIAVLAALAGVANYQPWPAVPRFAVATLALAGLAWVVSFATEQLG